jgi:hypothetical protein
LISFLASIADAQCGLKRAIETAVVRVLLTPIIATAERAAGRARELPART